MKTIELRDSFGIDSLVLADRPIPTPGAGEILLKVNAASLNYRDLLVVDGTFFPNLQFPFVPASDAAGQIEQVGSGVTKFKPGDRVTTHFIQDWEHGPFNYTLVSAGYLSSTLGGPLPGVLSEYVVLPERGVVAIPSYLNDEEAATLPIAGLTAWESFRLGSLQPGQTVLVQGTGGVSILALQFAKAIGARVIITSSSDEKLRTSSQAWRRYYCELHDKPGVVANHQSRDARHRSRSRYRCRWSGHAGSIAEGIKTRRVYRRRWPANRHRMPNRHPHIHCAKRQSTIVNGWEPTVVRRNERLLGGPSIAPGD